MVLKIKGGKVETLENFKKQTKNSSSGTRFATDIPKEDDGSLTVRFLQDIDEWVWYESYWDNGLGRPVLATEDNEEQYSSRGIYPSRKYLAAAVNKENNQVIVVRLPKSLAKQVEIIYSKKGSLLEYDVELWKTGSGKDGTEYHAMFDGREDLDLSRYTIPDTWAIVEGMVEGAGAGEDSVEDDTDDEEAVEEPVKKVAAKKIKLRAPAKA